MTDLVPGRLRTLNVNGRRRARGAALFPNLRSGKRRTIVALSSGLASIGRNADGGWIAYRMGKAALNMFIRSAAAELASDKFTCVAIDPGWVRTAMGGPGAPLTPDASVRAMLDVIEGLRPSDSGRFLDRRDGTFPGRVSRGSEFAAATLPSSRSEVASET